MVITPAENPFETIFINRKFLKTKTENSEMFLNNKRINPKKKKKLTRVVKHKKHFSRETVDRLSKLRIGRLDFEVISKR